MDFTRALVAGLVAATALTACNESGQNEDKKEVTLVTHDSFAVPKRCSTAFTKQTGITVKVLQQRRRRRGRQPGDPHRRTTRWATCSSASTTRSCRGRSTRALRAVRGEGPRPGAGASSSSTRQHRVTPIDYGDVCVNYDKAVVRREEARAAEDPRRPRRSPRTRTCSWSRTRPPRRPGLAFLLGDDRRVRRRRLARLLDASCKANGVKVVDGWEQAYNGELLRRSRARAT